MAMEITAQQIVDRIQENLGVPWKTSRVDVFYAGSPGTPVTGIATTFTPTLDVLRRAVADKKNLIITRERAFYRKGPPSDALDTDPACRFKRDFIAKNNLAIWRFYDNWQARKVDGQLRGLAMALGWDKYHEPDGKAGEEPYHSEDVFFVLPGTTLEDRVKSIRKRLNIRGIRVIGDAKIKVSKVALSHGMFRVPQLQKILKEPGVDAVVIGEPVEWEASPYFQDIVAWDQKKGMIILGHEVSEEPGSGEVAAWLKTFISEVPIKWIPAGEPFWVPETRGGGHEK